MRKQNNIILLSNILLFSLLIFVLTQYSYTYVMLLLILGFVSWICFFSIQNTKTRFFITNVLNRTLIFYRKNVCYTILYYETKKESVKLFLVPILSNKN